MDEATKRERLRTAGLMWDHAAAFREAHGRSISLPLNRLVAEEIARFAVRAEALERFAVDVLGLEANERTADARLAREAGRARIAL